MHETEQWTGWKRGQLSSFLGFFLSLSLVSPQTCGSAEMQSHSLYISIHEAPLDRP